AEQPATASVPAEPAGDDRNAPPEPVVQAVPDAPDVPDSPAAPERSEPASLEPELSPESKHSPDPEPVLASTQTPATPVQAPETVVAEAQPPPPPPTPEPFVEETELVVLVPKRGSSLTPGLDPLSDEAKAIVAKETATFRNHVKDRAIELLYE